MTNIVWSYCVYIVSDTKVRHQVMNPAASQRAVQVLSLIQAPILTTRKRKKDLYRLLMNNRPRLKLKTLQKRLDSTFGLFKQYWLNFLYHLCPATSSHFIGQVINTVWNTIIWNTRNMYLFNPLNPIEWYVGLGVLLPHTKNHSYNADTFMSLTYRWPWLYVKVKNN